MRFASYFMAGRASYGLCGEAGIVDLGAFFGAQYPTLRAAIASNALDELTEWADGKPSDAAIEDVEFLPLIPDAEKVICLGLNYRKRNPVEDDVADMEFPNFFLNRDSPIGSPRLAMMVTGCASHGDSGSKPARQNGPRSIST